MRRIIIDNARRKKRLKHGSDHQRIELTDGCLAIEAPPDGLIALDEALARLLGQDTQAAGLVKLTYFGGLTLEQAAEVMEVSPRTAYRHMAFARAWLYDAINKEDDK
jgi:RNA polymerase sigma factor (TIGR02999 family)